MKWKKELLEKWMNRLTGRGSGWTEWKVDAQTEDCMEGVIEEWMVDEQTKNWMKEGNEVDEKADGLKGMNGQRVDEQRLENEGLDERRRMQSG